MSKALKFGAIVAFVIALVIFLPHRPYQNPSAIVIALAFAVLIFAAGYFKNVKTILTSRQRPIFWTGIAICVSSLLIWLSIVYLGSEDPASWAAQAAPMAKEISAPILIAGFLLCCLPRALSILDLAMARQAAAQDSGNRTDRNP